MGDNKKEKIFVEVAYAGGNKQVVVSIEVDLGTTVLEAIQRSNILKLFPEINELEGRVGIFGELVPLVANLKAGDRVEIYRPLKLDPKEARRIRAKGTKTVRF